MIFIEEMFYLGVTKTSLLKLSSLIILKSKFRTKKRCIFYETKRINKEINRIFVVVGLKSLLLVFYGFRFQAKSTFQDFAK